MCYIVGMQIDWCYVRHIVLNDRLIGYKPDRASIDKLVSRLPDAKIHGFGVYSTNMLYRVWYLVVESRYFWGDSTDMVISIPMTQLPIYGKRLNVVQNILPPKPAG